MREPTDAATTATADMAGTSTDAPAGAPVPPPPPASSAHPRPIRPGDLTVGWRTVTAITWIGVALGFAAVWNASVQLGLATWWLGPRGEPQPRIVHMLPFVAPVAMVLATVNQVRRLPVLGLGAAVLVAAVGVGDVGRVTSLAVVELTIAGAAAAVSVASFTGVYRRTTS